MITKRRRRRIDFHVVGYKRNSCTIIPSPQSKRANSPEGSSSSIELTRQSAIHTNLTVSILGRYCRTSSQKEKRARNIRRFSLFECRRHLCAQLFLLICQLRNKLRWRRGQKGMWLKRNERKAFSALLHYILLERNTI